MVYKRNESAAEEVENLEAFERKTAAIETVFTLAVLYVSVLQVLSPGGVWRYVALIPIGGLLAVALLLGGDNLWNQIQSELAD